MGGPLEIVRQHGRSAAVALAVALAVTLAVTLGRVAHAQTAATASRTEVSQVQTLTVNVKLVQVNCSAFAKKPPRTVETVTDVSQVRLLEDGKPQNVRLRPAEDLPLTFGILFDVSGSETGEWDRMKRQTVRFLRATLRPGDRMFILTFASQLRMPEPLTPAGESVAKMLDRMDRMQAEYGVEVARRNDVRGGTRLWDAMNYALQAMSGAQGRRALVVFTDGDDNASVSDPKAVVRTSQTIGVPFYGVNVYSAMSLAQSSSVPGKSVVDRSFNTVIEQTGGRSFNAANDAEVADRLQQVASILRSQFVLEYKPADTVAGFHKLRVESLDSSIEIKAKSGVWR